MMSISRSPSLQLTSKDYWILTHPQLSRWMRRKLCEYIRVVLFSQFPVTLHSFKWNGNNPCACIHLKFLAGSREQIVQYQSSSRHPSSSLILLPCSSLLYFYFFSQFNLHKASFWSSALLTVPTLVLVLVDVLGYVGLALEHSLLISSSTDRAGFLLSKEE
jgi:hypothetical protein